MISQRSLGEEGTVPSRIALSSALKIFNNMGQRFFMGAVRVTDGNSICSRRNAREREKKITGDIVRQVKFRQR